MYYVDTSVLVAYYYPELISETAEKIILRSERPCISSLTEVEFASAPTRKVREKNLSPEDGNKIFKKFQSHIEQSLYILAVVEDKHYQIAKN